MKHLNDDELDVMLRLAKANPPKPSSDFADRVMRAYKIQSRRSPFWRGLFFARIPVPVPVGVLAAVALVLAGAMFGSKMRIQPATTVQERMVTKVVYRDRPKLSVNGLEPVAELHPRVVQSVYEGK